eukprot:364979-Chlamydomonas_euryale.AAC.1
MTVKGRTHARMHASNPNAEQPPRTDASCKCRAKMQCNKLSSPCPASRTGPGDPRITFPHVPESHARLSNRLHKRHHNACGIFPSYSAPVRGT